MAAHEFKHNFDRRFAGDDDHENDDGGEFHDIVVKGKVKSDEEACELYNSYAFKHGFGTRKGDKKTRNDKTVRQRFLTCSYAGFKKIKSDVLYQKRDFRTGCKAYIQFDVDKESGLYYVVKHEMEHNHSRVPVSKRHLIRSHRKVSSDQLAMVTSLSENGIPIADAYRVIRDQDGGEANLSFLQRDLYVALSGEKKKKFDGCDTKQLISYFKERKSKEYDFYYDFDVDEKGHLQSFFFRDSRMKVDYDAFGDLLVHDTTYRTNKYGMMCGPFVGMNHHNKNVMFGIGFVINEKWESFEWLFNTFLRSMGDKHPITIMTDQAQSMAKAIRIVFPNSRHRLCTWHIGENAKNNIKGLRAKEGFNDLFDIVLKYTDTMVEFEHYWSSMLTKYKCNDNNWLNNLHNIREMWCPAYSKDYFSGGILSSQRSETTNKSVSRRLHFTHGLCDFYKTFIEVVEEWRSKENDHDYGSITGNRHLVWADVGLLEHARRIYTIQMYLQFEDNFVNGVPCTARVIAMQPPLYEYHVGHPKRDLIAHTVNFDESEVTHTLRVLHLNNVTYIPKRYILKRWTKADMCTKVDDHVVEKDGVTPSSVWRLQYVRTFIRLIDRGQHDLSTCNVIEEAINECASRIEILLRKDGNEEGHGKENDDNTDAQAAAQCLESGNLLEPQDVIQANVVQDSPTSAEKPIENEKECMVKDPIRRRKKGQKNIRLKSKQEKICNKLKGQKIKSWKKKNAKGLFTAPEGNTLAHSSLFGGSIEYFEADEYFEVHVTPFT
ncbi:protein FAR1-RELATED SEQUENCE 5-like [Chenopodium quinoa]|uniref:protein FAR1-RELATED SEQUENCE 5-like n=1 Tax=Chenopodium quinoa TaxID=63459 RepID=UPI000B77D3F7|nr:protein FAR1-RELATED SEQUENCE 5-like [Chenopodium quinoa]